MGVTPTFSMPQIQKALEAKIELLEKAIVNRLSYLGEECMIRARSVNTYTDQTGNLRNSIGYVILKDGVVIKNNFKRSASVKGQTKSGKAKHTKGAKDGVVAGQSLAESLKSNYPRGFALIVVAGMNYAAAVEAKGKDVLTTTEQFAKKELPRMIFDLKLKLGKRKW